MAKLRRKEQRILDRYKDVRAPFKSKSTLDTGYLYIKDERKARKMDEYKILADEDLVEEDEEAVEDPFGKKARETAAKEAAKNAKDAKKWVITVFNFYSLDFDPNHILEHFGWCFTTKTKMLSYSLKKFQTLTAYLIP